MIYLGVGLIGTLILLSFFLEGIVWAICTICLIIYYFLRFIACLIIRPLRKLRSLLWL